MEQQAARTAEQVTSTLAQRTGTAAQLAGTAVQHAGDLVGRAGVAVERHGTAAAPAVGSVVEAGVERAVELPGTAARAARAAASAASGAAVDAASTTRRGAGTFGSAVAETMTGVLEEPSTRGGAAVSALRGQRVGPPVAVRRWPWAAGAALLGAGVAAGIVLVRRRVEGQDAPGAQEPHELRAVVDVPATNANWPEPSRSASAADRGPALPPPPPPV